MPRNSASAALSSTAGLVAPVTVAEIDLETPASINYVSVAEADCDEIRQALVLVRLHGRPLTTIVVDARAGLLDAESCTAQAWAVLRTADSVPGSACLAEQDLTAETCPEAALAASEAPQPGEVVPVSALPITVVVATRERAKSLSRCLNSLARLDYPDYEVVVVDNAPLTDSTAKLLQQRPERNVRYVREDQQGLAAAHNRGLEVAEGAIVAFTDDDVIVDRRWLTEIASAFRADTDVACVTGLIMAAELQTQAQVMLEAHGHFGKGFEQRVMDLGAHRPADPLFPFTAGKLGSGANMSFDRDKLRAMGGFDPAIGAGTVARGGDDLAAFFTVIASGFRLIYQPTALIWHHHRRDFDSLTAQAYGYGVGLGAYLASSLYRHPTSIGRALRQAPGGMAYAFGANSPRNATSLQSDWPRELTRREWRGLVYGPIAYGLSRWKTRKVSRRSPFRARGQ
jgi:GT2 family glycosyltransferase